MYLSGVYFAPWSAGVSLAVLIISITHVYPHFLDDMARARVALETARRQQPESFETIRAGLSAHGIAIGNLIHLTIMGTVISAITAPFTKGRA